MKTYLTEYIDPETNQTWAGPKIEAESFDQAVTKLQSLIYFGMVPPGTKVVGELADSLELSVGG